MDIGMLWYDDDAKSRLDEKVARAVEYYRSKYGVQPTECYVHPGMLVEGAPANTAGVRLCPSPTVIKNHFWLGVGSANRAAPAQAAPPASAAAPAARRAARSSEPAAAPRRPVMARASRGARAANTRARP
jgi:hypothetical protein